MVGNALRALPADSDRVGFGQHIGDRRSSIGRAGGARVAAIVVSLNDPAGEGVDRLLELFVGECVDGAGLFVDEVVVVMVGVSDLVACGAVASVEAVEQAELEEFLDDAVDGCGGAGVLCSEFVGDFGGAEQAVCFAGEEFNDHGACGA